MFVIDEVGAEGSRMVDFCDRWGVASGCMRRLTVVVENVMKTQVFVR